MIIALRRINECHKANALLLLGQAPPTPPLPPPRAAFLLIPFGLPWQIKQQRGEFATSEPCSRPRQTARRLHAAGLQQDLSLAPRATPRGPHPKSVPASCRWMAGHSSDPARIATLSPVSPWQERLRCRVCVRKRLHRAWTEQIRIRAHLAAERYPRRAPARWAMLSKRPARPWRQRRPT